MPARTEVSFTTCNLLNLNEPDLKMYGRKGWSQGQYDSKVEWLSNTLKHLDSSCYGFQELWHQDSLKAIFKKAKLNTKYDLLIPRNHKGSGIVCAGAVKKGLLVDQPEWIKSFPDKFTLQSKGDDPQTAAISVNINSFSRPILSFKIKPRANGKTIQVLVAHLKSKRPTRIDSESWYKADKNYYKKHAIGIGSALATVRRTAEAAALRMIITEQIKNNDMPLVVLGDLNDGQLSNTLNILTGQPNYLLSGLGGSDTGLYTVGTLQKYRSLRDVYYTHIYQDIKESLDHILVSQEFYDNSKRRLWAFKGMEIWNDHLNDDNHKQNGTVDHGIVKANFEYRPNKK